MNFMKKQVLMSALMLMFAMLPMMSMAQNGHNKDSETMMASQIQNSIEAMTLNVEFNYVYPMRMPSHYLTTTYSIRLKGDSIMSYLPYFGRAYRSNIANNDRSPLSFNSTVTDMTIKRGKKKDYVLVFKTRNDSELLEYTLTIFPNRQASLTVNSSDRESINFGGDLVL